ncbi:MAG TPA: MFS transporter [Tepidisphaeraceae bacterium]|nr:MFS transporter [Tepidisphaeraceae bacterium]
MSAQSPVLPYESAVDRGDRPALTVGLITLLHAFTHALQMLLVPLYLMVKDSLHLPGVKSVALVVAAYYVTYFGLSYFAGVLSDRFDRKILLAVGLIGNSAAILAMGLTHHYGVILALGVVAGLFGTIFHPAANALATAHYPRNPGMTIGIVGIGAGVGFFFGPRYAGWRAADAGWERPLIEVGAAGVITGVIFWLVAREVRRRHGIDGPAAEPRVHRPLGAVTRNRVLAAAALLGWRDFASQAATTLAAIFLLKAQNRTEAETGLILGVMMLSSIVINPIVVWFSPRRRRLPVLVASLVTGGAIIALLPHAGPGATLLVLMAFQTCSLSSFALGDAAMLERIDPDLRGRVIGLFLSLAGTLGATAPWFMSGWTDRMGDGANSPASYVVPFAVVGAMMAFSALSAPLIARFGRPATSPASRQDAEDRAMMAGEM